jgi:hypothetical protein
MKYSISIKNILLYGKIIMTFNLKSCLSLALLFLLILNVSALAQTAQTETTFENIELLMPSGDKIKERSVRLRFVGDEMRIETASDGKAVKTFKYSEIKDAEYSYSKNPRWKTGLGLGAAAFLFPPLFFVAIPLGFTKHRRHWLTIKTENDFAVLKLSKSSRKFVIPTLETKTGVTVSANGEDK